MSMSLPDSPTYSPSDSASMSEVPTEPLNPSERQMVQDYMSRRQHFLSDYERYNPVQNMHMLANHVFDLSENIFRLKADFTSSRRMLDIVAANQRDENETIRIIGDDLNHNSANVGEMRQEVSVLKQEIGDLRRETQEGINEIKAMMATLSTVVMQMRH